MAAGSGRRSAGSKRAQPIRSRAQADRLPLRSRAAWRHALEVLSVMRREERTLSAASQAIGIDTTTVRRYVGVALRKAHGRWTARASDHLYRPMQFPTPRGLVTLDTTDSHTARRIAQYWVAVDRFLTSGDERVLRAYRRRNVRVGKVGHPFITDPALLTRLARAGEVTFEDLYAGTAS